MANLAVANEILRQVGGYGKLKAMIGIKELVGSADSLQFGFGGSRKYNKCVIRLDPSDTYTFELGQYSKKNYTYTKKYELSGVYNDMLIDLFESKTGLYLSL